MEQQLVFGILITRIVLSGFLFANLSTLLYSLAGGIVNIIASAAIIAAYAILRAIFSQGFSIVGVSIAGGVSHNIAQLVVAAAGVEIFLFLNSL